MLTRASAPAEEAQDADDQEELAQEAELHEELAQEADAHEADAHEALAQEALLQDAPTRRASLTQPSALKTGPPGVWTTKLSSAWFGFGGA